jgi:hypothetical protein
VLDHRALSPSFQSNDFCDRAVGFSRLYETRPPESPPMPKVRHFEAERISRKAKRV